MLSRAAAISLAALALATPPAAAQSNPAPPAASAAATPAANPGWKTTIYPVYAFLPVFGADVNLPPGPELPPCDGCGPSGHVSSNFNFGIMAAARVEKGRAYVEGDILYAGMSAESAGVVAKVSVDTSFSSILGGFRVVDALSVEGGARRIGLNLRATVLQFPEYQWKPGDWTSVIGISYEPQLTKRLRLYTHYDYAGLENDHLATSTLNGRIEWQVMKHLSFTGGYGLLHLSEDGTIFGRPVHLTQTLHGPIVGIGIPF